MVRTAEGYSDFILPEGHDNTAQGRFNEMRMALKVAYSTAPAAPNPNPDATLAGEGETEPAGRLEHPAYDPGQSATNVEGGAGAAVSSPTADEALIVEKGLRVLLQLAVDEMRNVIEAVNHEHDTKRWPQKYGTPYGAINGMIEVREAILAQASAWGIELSPKRPPGALSTVHPVPTTDARPQFVWSRIDPGEMDYWEVTFGFNTQERAEVFRQRVTHEQTAPLTVHPAPGEGETQ